MSSKSVSTTVAKKLKYYLDVKRREDAFDLSGPYLPKEDPTPLRAGPTLAYDGIHDRSLKHYFRRNSIKKHLQHMTVPAMMSKSREKAIRRYVDETMATVDYRLKPGPISPYAFPQTFKPQPPPQRPKALRTVDEYFRTRKGSKRRKMPVHVVGKPRRIARSSPPEHIHNYERERLVNMASKLIVATETVALPQQKKQSKGFQTSGNEFPSLERSSKSTGSSTSGHESEGSINGRTPMPPRFKRTYAPQQRPQSSFFKSSSLDETGRKGKSGVHVVVPDSSENEKLRFLMDRMNLDGRGSSIVISPREIEKPRPKSAGYPLKSTANTAVETDLPDYSDDDFCSDEESSPRESTRTPRLSWVENKESDMIDTCTQTVVHSATQTKFPEYDQEQGEREFVFPSKLHWADRGQLDQTDGRQPVVIATTGASTSDVLTSGTSTSASHETQTRNRDLEPTVITYEVYVQTGDRLGAGSKVNVKITIFGEYGNSGERQLLRSKTHRNKFQRGQVDVFAVDSLFLGKLQSIRIGHSETRLGYGWFLDKVYIKEGPEATRAFEFRCNRWFSSRDDDGQIMRDLPRYDTVPASHADAILPKEKERKEELYSPSDSETSKSDSEESPREVEPRGKEKASRKKTKQKSQKKSKKTEKQEAKKQEFEPLEELGGIRGAKAENIFEVSEEDDQDQDENENEDRFFEPEEESESEQSEDEKIVNRKPEEEKSAEKIKPPKYPNLGFAVKTKRYAKKNSKVKDVKEEDDENKDKRKLVEDEPLEDKESEENEEARESHDENNNSEEEEEKESKEKRDEKDEESPKEEESNKPKKIAGSHLRVVTTAISPFLKSRQAAQPSPIAEEPSEISEDNQTKEKEEDSEEDEPKVEFTPKNEKKSDERPSSAKSDEFEEGFRAGIRKKQEDERKRHRASISESENVLKKGSSIHEAAKNGNLERIKELIQVVPAIKSTQDERGMTALHLAASNGHLNCVKWLAVSGVDLADETPTGYTAMHLAAMNGHVNCMMILAAMGSAISCKTIDSLTPLHLASMSGHFECVKWLLANRARMDAEDSNGRTPLDIAEEYEHEPIIKLLKKFKKELTRQDSTLAQLMTAEKRRKSMDSTSDNEAAPSKVSDSGVGGMESEEDNWISDTEEDAAAEVVKNEDKASTRKASTHSITDQEPSSRSRTDSIVSAEEKKKMFEMQRRKMKKRHSSFLDSIRMDVDNDDEF